MSEPPESAANSSPPSTTTRDRVLVAVFWAWAAVLVVATLAQLFRWQGVLDVLDVKRWFAR
jgi:hypothetical protein